MDYCDSLQQVISSISYTNDSLAITSDSLYQKSLFLAKKSDTNYINILRTIGSSGIIIILFIIERIVSYKSNKKTKALQFLFDVIVKPNIERITNFFSTFFELLSRSITTVREFNGSGDEIDLKKGEQLQILKQIKIGFDHEFISLVRSVDKERANSLSEVLNEIEDKATITLTTQSLSKIDMEQVEQDIHEKKAKFFEILYKKKVDNKP